MLHVDDKKKVEQDEQAMVLLCARSLKCAEWQMGRLKITCINFTARRNIDSRMFAFACFASLLLCFFFFFSLSLSFAFPPSEGHEPRKRNHDHRQSQIIIIEKKDERKKKLYARAIRD